MEEKPQQIASKTNKHQNYTAVQHITISANNAGQRIDNFLITLLKGAPRSYVYRILRKGEVRVNKKRIKPPFKLSAGDVVRIPPVYLETKVGSKNAPDSLLRILESAIVLEDANLIILNKPSGIAVHGGSGVRYGLIESFRQLRQDLTFLELVHRLDKETSGLVMLAKSRGVLLELHSMMKAGEIKKYYQTLTHGQWQGGERHIKNRVQRGQGQKKKVAVVDDHSKDANSGKLAESIFTPVKIFPQHSLLKVRLLTGRMHQIRTQLAHLGLPLVGDSHYGDFALNRQFARQYGLKRLFLHAYRLDFTLKQSAQPYHCEIPLAADLQVALDELKLDQ